MESADATEIKVMLVRLNTQFEGFSNNFEAHLMDDKDTKRSVDSIQTTLSSLHTKIGAIYLASCVISFMIGKLIPKFFS